MSTEVRARRLPDFIIIGRTKCGTTTLAEWLAQQPEVFFCRVKEPQFFSDETMWKRGPSWYAALYKGAAADQLCGEGTQNCTHPVLASDAAERIVQTNPHARLIYLVRHPVERLRSHYRQAMVWGDRSTSLEVTLANDADYLRGSMYFLCLAPYIERFAREQILVLRMEDLAGSAWDRALTHLGLALRPPPEGVHNVSAEGGVLRAPARLLRRTGLHRRLWWLPRSVRDFGVSMLRRRGKVFDAILEGSEAPIPQELLDPVWEDVCRLEDWLGLAQPLWPREPADR